MNGGSRIVDLRGRAHEEAPQVQAAPAMWEEIAPAPVATRVLAGVLIALSLAWVAGMIWLARGELTVAQPTGIATFAAALCMPPALLGVLWMLAMRSGRAEVRRFAGQAQSMRAESETFAQALAALSARIEDNRVALAQQTNALLTAGDNAVLQLAAVGTGLSDQAAAISHNLGELNGASVSASGKLENLLQNLPEGERRARNVALAFESAATQAEQRATVLNAQIEALIDSGRHAEEVVASASDRLTEGTASLNAASATATASLAANESAVARIGESLAGHRQTSEEMIASVAARTADLDATLAGLQARAVAGNAELATSLTALDASTQAINASLETGDGAARTLINSAGDALTGIDAVTREIDETLPAALGRLDQRIEQSRGVVAAAKPELLALVTAAESTNDAIASITQVLAEQEKMLRRMAGELQASLSESDEKAGALNVTVNETLGRTEKFIGEAAPQLVEALLRVRETANSSADRAREALSVVIPEAAAMLEKSSTAALKRAAALSVEKQVAALGEAAEIAVETAQRATDRLTRQLLTIADTTAAVEARIDAAEAKREAAEHESFSRQSAAIIEALHSAAIDIGGALSSEQPDSAWAAYLKGDRGVFTRRAVRLLETGEAREVATLYGDDSGFRDLVNRYIHDFEAMLRTVLAQSGGAPMGVTLLSSDMGKLYVALAQAIDRLRT